MQKKVVDKDCHVPEILWEQQTEKPKAIPSLLAFGDDSFGDETFDDGTCDYQLYELQ